MICERLKAARKECKLTQQQIADILGIDRSTYAYYELGVSNPSIDNLIALATIFNTEVVWLIGADKPAETWNAPESEISMLAQIREQRMAELSKEERVLVSLFRIAGLKGQKKEAMDSLKSLAGIVNDEK